MKKQGVWFVALVLMLTGAQAASAMGGTHGKGAPKKPVSVSTWPKGVAGLANREDRTGGYWINASDWFYYAGDAKAFNEFLQQYAKVQGTPRILVLGGVKGLAGAFGSAAATGHDWELSVAGWGQASATVTLPLEGRIRLKDIHVPANIQVVFVGEPNREVETFLAERNVKQGQVKNAAQSAK